MLMNRLTLEYRIVELAFTPLIELPEKLQRLGLKCEWIEDGESIVVDSGHMRVGLMDSDPITKCVQLGFAFCGLMWASAMPNLLEKVDAEWRRRKKNAKK